jgi:Transglycosylase-like domain
MARLAIAMGMFLSCTVGTVNAAEPDEEHVAQAAAEASVDPVDLQGALLTVGQYDPRTYLRHSGELPWPASTAGWGIWDRLAACESTGRWNAATGNGYFGGLQFDRQTWLAYGGGAYARTANLASKAQQIAVAEKLRAARGFQPWPACSRALGLR